MNLSKSTSQSTCRCMPKDFGAVSVQDRFHAKGMISLIMSNTRAVEVVRAGAVQWPGLKCLDTMIDLDTVLTRSTVDIYTVIDLLKPRYG